MADDYKIIVEQEHSTVMAHCIYPRYLRGLYTKFGGATKGAPKAI